MIGYIIIIVIISIFVSIVTEQMLIRRLQLSEGVEISRGKCRLKPGYGLISGNGDGNGNALNALNALKIHIPTHIPTHMHDIGEYSQSKQELDKFYKPLK